MGLEINVYNLLVRLKEFEIYKTFLSTLSKNYPNFVYPKSILHNRSHDIMKVMVKDDVIAVPPMEENEVLLSYLSPVWQLSDKVNVSLLGEMDKFVPISPERIKALDFHEPGVAHLRVEVRYLDVMIGNI